MGAVEVMILLAGSAALCTAMIAIMNRMLRSERRAMERRRQEWIDNGRVPEDEPYFID